MCSRTDIEERKMQIISDLHVDLRSSRCSLDDFTRSFLYPDRAGVLAVLGDVAAAESEQLAATMAYVASQFSTVLFVPGNHEFYSTKRTCKEELMSRLRRTVESIPTHNAVFLHQKTFDFSFCGTALNGGVLANGVAERVFSRNAFPVHSFGNASSTGSPLSTFCANSDADGTFGSSFVSKTKNPSGSMVEEEAVTPRGDPEEGTGLDKDDARVAQRRQSVPECALSNTVTRILGCTLWSHNNRASSDVYARNYVQSRVADYRYIYAASGSFGRTPRVIGIEDTNKWHAADVAWLTAQLETAETCERVRDVIVLSHHAPLRQGTSHPRFEKCNDAIGECFRTDLGGLFRRFHAKLRCWCFGHTHYRTDFLYGGARVASFPIGYSGELPLTGTEVPLIVSL